MVLGLEAEVEEAVLAVEQKLLLNRIDMKVFLSHVGKKIC